MTFERDALLRTAAEEGWHRVGITHHHGIDVLLSSLHSEKSGGIGEYLDLIPVIHWCKEIGFDVIQLLPLYDSGFDPSPYNALSSCALNPVYLALYHLPYLDNAPDLVKKIDSLKPYSRLPRVDYTHVLNVKIKWLREYFTIFKEKIIADRDYQHYKDSHPWLETYGLFKALKERFDHTSWEQWPLEFRHLDAAKQTLLLEDLQDPIEFYTVLQYFCFLQLKEVRQACDAQKILLKGDIPILVSRDSADVWHAPQFFDMNYGAGAPPDAYSPEGQLWGFPLFNWDALRLDDYRFWCERLHNASEFYHIYRIDHAVGFFRIWAAPLGEPSKNGKFIPADKSKWIPQGEHLLKMMLGASTMLPIAEDLGLVTDDIRACLTRLGIPGTKIIRWERKDHEIGAGDFIPYKNYPVVSLTSISTHDSETLTLWWQDPKEGAELFAKFKGWTYEPILSYEQRLSILKDTHSTPSLFHINLLQEYFALFPDLVAEDPHEERINLPGTILPTNWTYRYRTKLESWTSHQALKQSLTEILSH